MSPVDSLVGDNIFINDHRFRYLFGCNSGPDVIDCSQLEIFEIVDYVIICSNVAIFGVIANLINMVVFYKQGFQSTVNISFFSMAISDLCCLLTLLWICMCLNPFIIAGGVPWVPGDFFYLPGAWPHVVFGRITCYITVFITAERCLSVITPLKVKQIITPRRTAIVIGVIYIVNMLVMVPEYATAYYHATFYPELNTTLIEIIFRENRDTFMGLVFILSSAIGFLGIASVIIWTVVLVIKLRQTSKWRKQTGNDRVGNVTSRNKKTVKMVAIISTILIVCYTPSSIVSMATFAVPRMNIRNQFINISTSVWSLAFVFDSVNSSINIFLYYKMSSNYRQTFDELFPALFKRRIHWLLCSALFKRCIH